MPLEINIVKDLGDMQENLSAFSIKEPVKIYPVTSASY